MQERPKHEKPGTVEEDQKNRDYYYDDAHGYEEYDPEHDEEPEESTDEDTARSRRKKAGQAALPDLRRHNNG